MPTSSTQHGSGSSTVRAVTHLDIESPDDDAVTCLASAAGLSKMRIKQAMSKGAVWLTRGRRTTRLRRATRRLAAGDSLDLYYDEHVLAREPPVPELIADEGAYSVWFKPCGMLSQGSRWGDHCTITRWAERHLTPERPSFTVHRLDRAATGLIAVAHEKRAAAALSKMFQDRAVEKRYLAVVRGRIDAPGPVVVDAPIDGRRALSQVREIEHDGDGLRSLVEVRIETGRKHQIRRHLAALGTPVVGDRLYGAGDAEEDLKLAAFVLAFDWPGAGRRRYELPASLLPSL